MLPLALLAAVLVGAVLPAVHQAYALQQRAAEAAAWAGQIATVLTPIARRRPTLWAFDDVLLRAALAARTPGSSVRIDVPSADAVFEVPGSGGPEIGRWAAIRVDGRAVGRVRVGVDARATWRAVQIWWGAAAPLGVLLGALLFWVPVRTVRRADERDAALWEALEAANATLEGRVADRTEALRALSARLLEVQEEERARLSRNLHDELGQTLTALRLHLTALDLRVEGPAAAEVAAALGALDDGVEQVRRLAHDLRPPALDALGLPAALASHAERWAETAGLELELDIDDGAPDADAAEVVFRVAQEALTNIARHAEATRGAIVCGPADDGWRLVVEDDGRGLPAWRGSVGPGGQDGPDAPGGENPDPRPLDARSAEGRSSGGLGLLGARERVEGAGGYLDLERGARGGVRITVWVPDEGTDEDEEAHR
jgi:signal transduction histidine kinase